MDIRESIMILESKTLKFADGADNLVFVNPNKIQIHNLLAKSDYSELRVYIDMNSPRKDLYVWDSTFGIHSSMMTKLNRLFGLNITFNSDWRGYMLYSSKYNDYFLELDTTVRIETLKNIPYYDRIFELDEIVPKLFKIIRLKKLKPSISDKAFV